jgi:hypothetical protein
VYEIIDTDRYANEVETLRGRYGRIDKAIAAAKKLIQLRGSESFGSVIGKDEWFYFRLSAAPTVPACTVFFRVDEESQRAYLMKVDLCATPEEED